MVDDGDPRDRAWQRSVRAWGRIFNSWAFWVGGFAAGFAGVWFAWVWVDGVPAYRLLVGVHYFFYLWLGVGFLSARLYLRRFDAN